MDSWSGQDEKDIQCCLVTSDTSVLVEARTVTPGDRRAFSTRKIRQGQIILKNRPYTLVPKHSQEYCSSCFKPNPTKRCSHCQHVWYCSRQCQIHDFPSHRIECREYPSLWPKDRTSDDEKESQWNTRLLIRTFLRIQKEIQNENSNCQRNSNDGNSCTCSQQHFRCLQSSRIPFDQSELQSFHLAKQALRRQRQMLTKHYNVPPSYDDIQLRIDLENILRRFSINNFGIVDDMLRVTGRGVYPLTALLNHSCTPNCILRYTTEGGILEVIAAFDILPGIELTHSYVDLVSTTTTRNERLQTTYGFQCTCQRCQNWKVSLPSKYDVSDTNTDEIIDGILNAYYPGKRVDESDSTLVDLDTLLRPPVDDTSSNSIILRVQSLQREANLAMANDDIERELSCLSEAVNLLVRTSPSPFSLDLYEVRCQRLSSWIVAQEPKEALKDCRHVVCVLCLALSQIPCHPLLGLQLFTLGDLYEACGQFDKARQTHTWAKHVLSVTLGPSNHMVKMLHDKLR